MDMDEMNEEIKVDFNSEKYYNPTIELLRGILMFFMCINLYGFPGNAGGMISAMSGFSTVAFFIISGYLVLRDTEDRSKRIVRSILRCAIIFGILTVVYFVMNFFFYLPSGANVFDAFKIKRCWFNFIVLNAWQFDIGGAIWYIQALLYAYIIIFFLDKYKLLKYDYIIAAVLIVFAVVTGELSGIFKFNILGYTYINGNFLTRALPYVLLGSVIRRNMQKIASLVPVVFFGGIALGTVMMLAEIYLVERFKLGGYFTHLIGMPVTAVSVCILAFLDDDYTGMEEPQLQLRWRTNIIYYISPAVSVGVAFLLSSFGTEFFVKYMNWNGLITFAVSFVLSRIIARIFGFGKRTNE